MIPGSPHTDNLLISTYARPPHGFGNYLIAEDIPYTTFILPGHHLHKEVMLRPISNTHRVRAAEVSDNRLNGLLFTATPKMQNDEQCRNTTEETEMRVRDLLKDTERC